jgi:hypothetical protein
VKNIQVAEKIIEEVKKQYSKKDQSKIFTKLIIETIPLKGNELKDYLNRTLWSLQNEFNLL